MKYDIIDLEKKYNIKLDDTQLSVLSGLINFIESDEHTICLKAMAGTGNLYI